MRAVHRSRSGEGRDRKERDASYLKEDINPKTAPGLALTLNMDII